MWYGLRRGSVGGAGGRGEVGVVGSIPENSPCWPLDPYGDSSVWTVNEFEVFGLNLEGKELLRIVGPFVPGRGGL